MRYAANLLFEYGVDGRRKARPLCEKRIVVFEARGPREAVRKARQYGKRGETAYKNAEGQRFRIRFVGLIDVLSLEHSEPEEVYYSMVRTTRPASLVRPDKSFEVFRTGPRTIESAWWAVPAYLAKSPQRSRRAPLKRSAWASRRR
jgi:Domain of unknown function (DUF4288)